MITFESVVDIRCRQVDKPQIAKLRIVGSAYRFIVIGTQYGYIRTTGGDVRTWQTRSGAARFLKRYVPL